MFYALLKWVLVLALLACGVFFLATGLGATIPAITYKGLNAQGVPVGVALLVVGVTLAVFWKISLSETVRETTTTTSPDGRSETKWTETKTVKTLSKFE